MFTNVSRPKLAGRYFGGEKKDAVDKENLGAEIGFVGSGRSPKYSMHSRAFFSI